MNATDAYHILGLQPGASEKEIKAAYRRLVKKVHPDVNQAPGAEQQFVLISNAYKHLLVQQGISADPFQEEWTEKQRKAQWKEEQRIRWKKRQEEKNRQRLYLLQKLYRVLNYIVAAYFVFASLLALDYALPAERHPEEVIAVAAVYKSSGTRGSSRRVYSYDDVYFRNFKLRVGKGEGPAALGQAVVYATPVLNIVRKAEVAGTNTRLYPAYGFYNTFGFLIPLALLLGIGYYRLPLSGEGRLNVGLVVLFIALFHLTLALVL